MTSTHPTTTFCSQLVAFGPFQRTPDHPAFEDSGPIRYGHLLVFPRTGVRIIHEGDAPLSTHPIVASPNVVMFYNRGQIYRRQQISARGDICDWFAFDSSLIVEALGDYDKCVEERPDRPFTITHAASDPASYLVQRRVTDAFARRAQGESAKLNFDTLQVEEILINLLARILQHAYQSKSLSSSPISKAKQAAQPATQRARRDLAYAVQELLALRFNQSLSLEQIAREVHSSPYHLCRVFRRQTGQTIHGWLEQLRLRTALEAIPDAAGRVTDLALDLGYSSHSHFSSSFRRTFGLSPSQLQQRANRQHLQNLSKKLIV